MDGLKLDELEAEQFYRVVLAIATARVLAIVLTIFSAVADPNKSNARVSVDAESHLAKFQPISTQFIAPEWW